MSNNNVIEFPRTGQGQIIYDEELQSVIQDTSARPATEEDIDRDNYGYTDPNLHRRVDPQEHDIDVSGECAPRDYQLNILGVDSYRTTTTYHHDDVCEGDKVYYREVEQSDGSTVRMPIEIP